MAPVADCANARLLKARASALFLCVLLSAPGLAQADANADFFEARIRPVLVERCYSCHSVQTKAPKGKLRLDSREAVRRGGSQGPAIVPGKPDESLLIKALSHDGDVSAMPPDTKLADSVIADFRHWIAAGAIDPRVESSDVGATAGSAVVSARDFWAFRVPHKVDPPSVCNRSWAWTELDQFILAKLETNGLHPAQDADRHTWLRRVSLDLTGLPPSPYEIDAFMSDHSPTARERVVDRLLASPAFGERWARHWLDLTGYADQIGTANDIFAEHAWRYRDYVIKAFRSDVPIDRFIREQIAGDLLKPDSDAERANNTVATGFLVLGDLTVVEADKEKLRVDVIDQQVDKVGKAFLGLTLGCARCHDHKFDPIPMRDYYALAGIFSSTQSIERAQWGVWSWPTTARLPETAEQQSARVAQLAVHQKTIERLTAERTAAQARLAALASSGSSVDQLRHDLEATVARCNAEIEHSEFFAPAAPVAFAVRDSSNPGGMRITIRGKAHSLGEFVPRGLLSVIAAAGPIEFPSNESGRRQLAEWIASSNNPLTARVAVNRIWQKLFGEGIVRSVDYFGIRGEKPTHPELLDALAIRLVASGWSRKRIIRELVLSRSYAMASAHDGRIAAIDPDNRLLWRMNRARLDAETLRDAMLAVAGSLKPSGGGPGLPLEFRENTGGLGKGGVNPPSFQLARFRPEQEFVRTVYLPIVRSYPQAGPAEIRNVFDFTPPGEVAGQRAVTTVPTQALFLLNAPFLKRRAAELAHETAPFVDPKSRLATLWIRVLNRPITAAESEDCLAFLDKIRQLKPGPHPEDAARDLGWPDLCHALLSSNEFLIRL